MEDGTLGQLMLLLGLDAETLKALLVAGVLLLLQRIFEYVAKRIPDDETGWRSVVRDVARRLALYTRNVETKEQAAAEKLAKARKHRSF